jgi:hypothetical protein
MITAEKEMKGVDCGDFSTNKLGLGRHPGPFLIRTL